MASQSTPFPVENIPFGVISTRENPTRRCATALHNDAVDLSALEKDGFFDSVLGFDKGAIFSKVTIPKHQRLEVSECWLTER
jgi:fumarylacetoacetase